MLASAIALIRFSLCILVDIKIYFGFELIELINVFRRVSQVLAEFSSLRVAVDPYSGENFRLCLVLVRWIYSRHSRHCAKHREH